MHPHFGLRIVIRAGIPARSPIIFWNNRHPGNMAVVTTRLSIWLHGPDDVKVRETIDPTAARITRLSRDPALESSRRLRHDVRQLRELDVHNLQRVWRGWKASWRILRLRQRDVQGEELKLQRPL